jgi:hypothetical protein
LDDDQIAAACRVGFFCYGYGRSKFMVTDVFFSRLFSHHVVGRRNLMVGVLS